MIHLPGVWSPPEGSWGPNPPCLGGGARPEAASVTGTESPWDVGQRRGRRRADPLARTTRGRGRPPTTAALGPPSSPRRANGVTGAEADAPRVAWPVLPPSDDAGVELAGGKTEAHLEGQQLVVAATEHEPTRLAAVPDVAAELGDREQCVPPGPSAPRRSGALMIDHIPEQPARPSPW